MMDNDIEVNEIDAWNALKTNSIISENLESKLFLDKGDPLRILYLSEINTSDRFDIDLTRCQLDSNWGIYKAANIEEVFDLVCQTNISLILVKQASSSEEWLNKVASIGTQLDIPILAVVDREDEAIAIAAFDIGAYDYITLEELRDSKILQRTIRHGIACHRWKMQNDRLQQIDAKDQNKRKKAETDLRESEEYFHILSEYVPIGIFQADLLGKQIYTNTYLKNLCLTDTKTGLSQNWTESLHPEDRTYLQNIGILESEENLGQNWIEHVHPDDREEVVRSYQNFIQGIGSFHLEFRFIRSQADIRWVVGQVIPLINSNGETTGFVGSITDITERKQAEEKLKQLNIELECRVFDRISELQKLNLELRIGNKIREFHEAERQKTERELHIAKDRLQAVLDAVPGCVAWVSADLSYLGMNQLMAQTFQLDIRDFMGETVGFNKSKAKDYVDFAKRCFAGSEDNISEELEFEFDEGNKKHYLLIGQKYAQGRSAVFVAIEITERKRAEVETQRALEKVEELSELKSRFIFMVSHEFRTPLTSIFSASELLEHYGQKWPPEKILQYLKQIQESVRRMNGLLEDVLIIGAGEVGKLKIKPTEIDIVQFCQQLIEETQLSKQNHHAFNFTHDTRVQRVVIDSKLLRHILSNLLSNAAKYSPVQKPIDLNLRVDSRQITLEVVDLGIGIPQEDQKYLFDLFHRATNVGTIGGTGIGLSIVKKSVDALGGIISFKSEVNSGSKFTVSIPIDQVNEEYQW
ncbi:ATP-binding protein [Altericista sp. CCNU0014]|uniref:ATP-binding protein n=1 Tax=Altericista sp. CCNU0014 TaxID=3082949 RepID=UPI00385119E8